MTERKVYFIDINDNNVNFDIFNKDNVFQFIEYAESIGNVTDFRSKEKLDESKCAIITTPSPAVTACNLFHILKNDKGYQTSLDKFNINDAIFEDLLIEWLLSIEDFEVFRIQKKYLDLAWVCIGSDIYDDDSIWEDWVDYLKNL